MPLREWEPEEATDKIDEVLESLTRIEEDDPDTWDRGSGYFYSTREFLTSVRGTIERNQRVSGKQQKAIRNCADGVAKWQH